ncbi:MFS transporter [Pseudonocardia acaciae]|uniref:MFS transporter n=1 Tax=Pseudonocardia acaciae TaxID=551276 RepID=UPI000566C2F0|nr:MFS transporter [Pseudonocardia acaciae]
MTMRGELFGPRRRATTVGVLLLILMVAFEAMGVGTAMPALVAELGTVSLYALPFVAFMAAAVFGTVVGGRWCDLSGPRVPLVLAPVLFGAGLVTAGTAGSMAQLLVGRVLQGLGAGSVTVAIYVLIALLYPERIRPAMFGSMSSAWVLPSLVGPPVAGLVTERLSWRWVFFGLVPVVVLALALVVPAVRRLDGPDPSRERAPRRRGLVLAAFGAAAGVSGISAASERIGVGGALIAVGALVVLVPSIRRLLPAGVFRARRGVPTVVAARGLCAALFFTSNSYIPLALTSTHRWSLAAAGIPLVVGSLGWSAASIWQGRHPDLPRARLLRIGFCLLAAGAGALLLVAPSWGVAWLAVPVWAMAGLGMGLCFPSVAFLLLRLSDPAEVGFHTSAAQMSDQLGSATMIAVGGGLLAVLGTPSVALPVLYAVLAGLGVVGALIAGRTTVASG